MNLGLLIGGGLSAVASAAHLAIIVGGPAWYRFFGAGERFARAAERGSPMPAVVTVGIATVLAVWSAYAFSGAGVIPRLPLLGPGLLAITAVYLARALLWLPMLALRRLPITAFAVWSSAIVLIYGIAYAVGTWAAWPGLSG